MSFCQTGMFYESVLPVASYGNFGMQTVSLCFSLFARLLNGVRAFLSVGISVCVLAVATPVQAQHPDCVSASSDSDGDGWGWENNRSCVVVEDTASSSDTSSSHPICRSAESDADGDGFGYEDGHESSKLYRW